MANGLIMVMLLLLEISSAQDVDSATLSEHLIAFKPYLGKTYEGDFINSTKEHPMRDVLTWERSLNGNAIKMIHSVNHGEYGGETMIMWDPITKGLRSWYFTTAGSLTLSTVEIRGEQFITIEDVAGNQNGITKVKTVIQLLYGEKLQKKTKYLMNNMWVDGNEMIYERVYGKGPLFE